MMTVLGFSLENLKNAHVPDIKLSHEFSLEDPSTMLHGLYFDANNPDRQEVISVFPNEVSPIANLTVVKTAEAAEKSPFFDSEIVEHFLNILSQKDMKIEKETDPVTLKMLKCYIARGFC